MRRYLEGSIIKDLKEKIVFLSGPRQVGKTTLARQLEPGSVYLNYDSSPDRKLIQQEEWSRQTPMVIFDELHKMSGWKSWIKGIYDVEGIPPSLLVTGSARLETVKKSGDSLAGRFFSYRLHPITVKEAFLHLNDTPESALVNLLEFGGFPEPYLKKTESFAKRWRRSHVDVIIRGDLMDLEKVRDIKRIEILLDLLKSRVGSPTSFSSLANDLQVSVHTVKHWLQILENMYVIFSVRPFHKNIARSILKEAKYYFYDTGSIENSPGSRLENTVANALLRELHFIEDTTGSHVSLNYLRDKDKNEVDFLAVVDNKPVMMVEVKTGDDSFSKSIFRFHSYLPSAVPVQVVHKLSRKKQRGSVVMLPAHEFLHEFTL